MPNSASYDDEYFATLYGEQPRQTWADKVRDERIVRLVRQYGPQSARGGALLDIGCGYGYLLERFRGRFALYGMDISQHAVEQAAARLRDAHFAQGDIEQGIPHAGPFQVVLAVNVVEHLADPRGALTHIHRALLPGGLCIVHLPTVNNGFNALVYRFTYSKDVTHVYRPSGRALRALFADVGFDCLEESYSPHKPQWLWNILKPHPAYLAAFRRR